MIASTTRRALFGCALAALTPLVARGQRGDSLLKAQLLNGMYPPAEARALLQVIADAEARNVPTGILEKSIREGAATNASGAQVLRMARADLAALEDARRELGPLANDPSVETAANLLRSGTPAATLREFRNARSSQAVFLPLKIAWDLVRFGVPVDTVNADLVALVRAGADDKQLLSISLAVVQARYAGESVFSAYRSRVMALRGAR